MPAQPVFTTASPEDAAGIVEVQRRTWIASYPNEALGISEEDIRMRIEGEHGELLPAKVERWQKSISDGARAIFVAKVDGSVVGFSAPRRSPESGQLRLGALYVLPEAQGLGIGSALMRSAIGSLGREEDIYLHVLSYNGRAIAFYERFGFKKTGAPIVEHTAPLRDGRELPEVEMVLRAKPAAV